MIRATPYVLPSSVLAAGVVYEMTSKDEDGFGEWVPYRAVARLVMRSFRAAKSWRSARREGVVEDDMV